MRLAALLASALIAASPAGAEVLQVELTGTLVSQVEPGVDPFFAVGDQITLRARFDSDRTAPWENGLTVAAFGETSFGIGAPLGIAGFEYFRIEGNGLVWSAFDDRDDAISLYTESIDIIYPDLSGSDFTQRALYGPGLVFDSEGHVRGLSGAFIRGFTDSLPTLIGGSNLQGHYEAEIFPDGHSNIFSEYTTDLDSYFEIQPGRANRFNTTDSRGFIGVWDFANSRVTVVPEPATWAMLIVGFLIVGSAARRWRTGWDSNPRWA